LSTENTLSQALAYARDRGWRIFPVNSAEKEPLIKKWPEKATTDLELIAYWFRKFPDAGIGIATGPKSQLCVIDLDGEHALARLTKEGRLPPTLTATTGREGGKHLYFSTPTPLTGHLDFLGTPGNPSKIDIRCRGNFVIAPPSVHQNGKVYTWENPDQPIASLPDWLELQIEFWVKPKPKPKPPPPTQRSTQLPPKYAEDVQESQLLILRHALDGTKHKHLLAVSMRIAGLVKAGWSDEATQTTAMLEALLENPCPPKSLEGARKTIASAFLKATPERPPDPSLTERALGLRFVQETKDIKYLQDAKHWFRFNGVVWDEWPEPCHEVADMVDRMIDQGPPEPETEPGKYERSLRRFHSYRAMNAVVNVVQRAAPAIIKRKQMNADPFLFNCQNGTVDLRTGQLHPHKAEHLLTLVSPFDYEPKAKHAAWTQALATYTGGDKDLAKYLQRLVGSCLVREVAEEKFWLFRGDGANGKTAFLEAVTGVMGPYAKPATPSSIISRANEQHTSAIGALYGCGLAYIEELERGATMDMDKVKRYYTGRSPVSLQLVMQGNFVDITPSWKLIISSNHDPHFPDSSRAARRRFTVVPFDHDIPHTILNFTKRLLQEEGPGVLRWLIDGALEYVRHGLGSCKAVDERTAKFHADQDPLADFIGECCIINPTVSSPFRDLWLAYVDYCTQGKEHPMPKKAMGAMLTNRGFPEARFGHGGQRGRAGIALTKDLANQYASRMMSS